MVDDYRWSTGDIETARVTYCYGWFKRKVKKSLWLGMKYKVMVGDSR